MAAIDPSEEMKELGAMLGGVETVLDLDGMRRALAELRDQAADPELWNDQDRAQQVTRRLSHLEGELGKVEGLRSRLDDAGVLLELASEEGDDETRGEAERELGVLRKEIEQLEVRTLMSGEYDSREALVTINSQAG
ncbi:MAG: PCRF domain-containing protein, partial [Actinoallomurus sp.]